jgi:acetyl esterase/lipase
MATKSIPAPTRPLYNRIQFFFRLWALKSLTAIFIRVQRYMKPLPLHQQPTLLKKYSVRSHLTNRVFIPRSHNAGELLPLYINIHGGGFALCSPTFDDEWCAHFCHTYNILVVSLDYSKAPRARFPIAADDVEALVKAVLSDESLPIDTTRVVIGGFSAGGNLALSAAQASGLRGKIHGVVPWYPVTDFVSNAAQKAKLRPRRNEKDVDQLTSTVPVFNWGYVTPGEDLTNPRLSVSFADKKDLPKWIFMVGAEYDLLCNEAKVMIMNLAGLSDAEREEGIYEFERGTYRWRVARGVEHGYTQSFGPAATGELPRQRREETYAEVGDWLFKGPFSKAAL